MTAALPARWTVVADGGPADKARIDVTIWPNERADRAHASQPITLDIDLDAGLDGVTEHGITGQAPRAGATHDEQSSTS